MQLGQPFIFIYAFLLYLHRMSVIAYPPRRRRRRWCGGGDGSCSSGSGSGALGQGRRL